MEKKTSTVFLRSIVLVAALTALLAGCASAGGPTPSSTAGGPTPSVSSDPVPTPTPVADGECSAEQLSYALQSRPEDSGAGSFYWNLVLSNTGASECTFEGTPTVFVLAEGGRAIGGDQGTETTPGVVESVVTLVPGASAYSLLHLVQAGALGCPIVPVTQLGIALPGSTAQHPVATPNTIDGCDDTTSSIVSVGPLAAEPVTY